MSKKIKNKQKKKTENNNLANTLKQKLKNFPKKLIIKTIIDILQSLYRWCFFPIELRNKDIITMEKKALSH